MTREWGQMILCMMHVYVHYSVGCASFRPSKKQPSNNSSLPDLSPVHLPHSLCLLSLDFHLMPALGHEPEVFEGRARMSTLSPLPVPGTQQVHLGLDSELWVFWAD